MLANFWKWDTTSRIFDILFIDFNWRFLIDKFKNWNWSFLTWFLKSDRCLLNKTVVNVRNEVGKKIVLPACSKNFSSLAILKFAYSSSKRISREKSQNLGEFATNLYKFVQFLFRNTFEQIRANLMRILQIFPNLHDAFFSRDGNQMAINFRYWKFRHI